MPGKIHRSVCPYDCPDSCGLLVEVLNGHAISVKGDPDHNMTRGNLCAKMNHYERTVHSSRRLTEPLLRCGKKGSGEFRPIPWDEAIKLIGRRWGKIIESYGPEAILPYSYAGTMGLIQRNAGHPFFHRMGASLLDRGICMPAKGAGWEAVMGDTPAPRPDEVLHSDLVILWSSDAAATNIHLLHKIKQAKKKGAKVWMIDLYQNQTTKFADQTFLVNPGSDGALALGLMHILVRDGLCDYNFIEHQVQGFTELSEQILPEYPPEKVADISGLDAPTIVKMAHAFAAARAPFISLGGGVTRYTNGAMSTRCIVTLPALVGAWAKKGGGCFIGTSTSAAFAMEKLLRTDLLQGTPRTVSMNCLGEALNNLDDPPLQGLYVYHSNPAAVAPDQNQVLAGLAREDLFTVVHERFMTDTARYADIVLPATSSLETADIYRSYGSYSVQQTQAVIPAIGQSKSNRQVFALLAAEMGYSEDQFFRSDQELIHELMAEPNNWWDHVDMQDFTNGRQIELTPPTRGYLTPSEKIEIHNGSPEEPLPRYHPPVTDGYPLQLVTAPAMKTLNSTFFERDELRDTQMLLRLHPVEAEQRGLKSGERVTAFNKLGEVEFYLMTDKKVPAGLALAAGVWWLEFAPGQRSVNALCSQRLTDRGMGSTFYDNRVDIRAAG